MVSTYYLYVSLIYKKEIKNIKYKCSIVKFSCIITTTVISFLVRTGDNLLKERVNLFNEIIQGLFFIILGIIFLTRISFVYSFIYYLFIIMFTLHGFSTSFTMLFNKKFSLSKSLLSLTSFIIVAYSLSKPTTIITFIPFVVGWFALINAIIQGINYYVYRRDCLKGTGYRLMLVIFTSLSALVLLFYPQRTLNALSQFTGFYLVFNGLITLVENTKDLISPIKKRKLLSRLNISIPIFMSALVPQKVYLSYSNLIKNRQVKVNELKQEKESDVEVFFYLTSKMPESLGHVDISFEGKIYSYGCHDPLNRKLFGTLGEGVLIVSERDAFIKNALSTENKMVLSYGISLNAQQRAIVKNRIEELLKRGVPWKSGYEVNNDIEFMDYASRVYKHTKAKMFKFNEGKFRTYFVFSTNCVLLADHILRSPQLDLFSFLGIVTPGTYLTFLNSEFRREGSIVIKRNIMKENEYARS